MIESIKNRIWDMLKEKDVSLAMLYDKEGNILWQRGRKIKGKTIPEGEGFSKSCIEKTLSGDIPIKEEDVVISLSSEHLPHSARVLYIKSLFIQPLAQEADKGTLFFDEIAEIPLSFQARLLQLIDVKKYRWLGDARERFADLRIVAASNRDLEEEVKQNRFRKDLFFRLNVLPIEIPPLRERKEDIAVIVNEYQSLLKGKTVTQGFWEVLSLLGKYYRQSHWNLKAMARSLNLPEKDYPRFISALHKYGVHPGKSEKELMISQRSAVQEKLWKIFNLEEVKEMLLLQ
jgi:hypothetical protein